MKIEELKEKIKKILILFSKEFAENVLNTIVGALLMALTFGIYYVANEIVDELKIHDLARTIIILSSTIILCVIGNIALSTMKNVFNVDFVGKIKNFINRKK